MSACKRCGEPVPPENTVYCSRSCKKALKTRRYRQNARRDRRPAWRRRVQARGEWNGAQAARFPAPVLGPAAKAALRLEVEGTKRRKLIVLLAAYSDAGVPNPPVRVLARHMGVKWKIVDALVARLEKDGYLAVERTPGERNVYTLRCVP